MTITSTTNCHGHHEQCRVRGMDRILKIGSQQINQKGWATSPAFRHEKEFLEDADISPPRRVIPLGANVSATRSESLNVSKSSRKEVTKWLPLQGYHFHHESSTEVGKRLSILPTSPIHKGQRTIRER